MNSFVVATVFNVLIINVICEVLPVDEKQAGESISSCNVPSTEENGIWLLKKDDKKSIVYQLKCNKGYIATNQNTTIECIKGKWSQIGLHCKDRQHRILYKNLIFIIPSVVFVILIIIFVIIVLLKNKKNKKKKSGDSIPRWTKNQLEREITSEQQEKVYKNLVEVSRSSFRFPFFLPKGRPTGKKPILLEEDGYVVPNSGAPNCDLICDNEKEIIENPKDSDFQAAPSKNEKGNTSNPKNVATILIKEFKEKRDNGILLSSAIKKRQNKNTTDACESNTVSKNVEEKSFASSLKPVHKHAYTNLKKKKRRNIEETIHEEPENPPVLHEKLCKRQVDPSITDVSSSFNNKDFGNEENDYLVLESIERVDIQKTDSTQEFQDENYGYISLSSLQSQLDSIVSDESINESQSSCPENNSSANMSISIQSVKIVSHENPSNVKDLKNKHLYCNLVAMTDVKDNIAEERHEGSVQSTNSHIYVNIRS